MSDLLLHNATVLTMDPSRPRAEAVLVRAGRIDGVDNVAGRADRIDCQGGVLLPAFIDAHCHLLAYAASLRSVDCTAARSIDDIVGAIAERATAMAPGAWIRAFGYEETSLVERRQPTRHDLDRAAPAHLVRLVHRGGHASVLNSAALRLAGIDSATEEPPGGAIERDVPSGEPNGVLLGMERRLDGLVPPMSYEELRGAVAEASARLLRAGITCVQDATHTNGASACQLFERLMTDDALPLDVVLMEGFEHLGELPEIGAEGCLRRGAVKIMIEELGDGIAPEEKELSRRVRAVHEAGRQVAVHAVGERAVAAAARAIEEALRVKPRADHRHRIEHCGLLPAGLAVRLARLGVIVVSQPAFVYERGERYLQLVAEADQSRLYAFRTLRDAGVAIAAGSDAPVTVPEPLASVAAAVERRSAAGRPVAAGEAVDVAEALAWWTAGAAQTAFLEGELGSIRPGLRADLVLLPAGALEATPARLRAMTPARLWRAGREVPIASPAVVPGA